MIKVLKDIVRKYWLGMAISLLVLSIVDYIFNTVCISTILFGVPCPACGMTRAAKLLLTGHFARSFQMHPLLLLVVLEAVFYLIIKAKLPENRLLPNASLILCLAIIVCFYIYRMWVYYPYAEPLVYRPDNYLRQIIGVLHELRNQ